MPNRPLIKQPIFVPLYAGLNTEIVDKLVQPQNGVLAMENMVCALTGEISKRDGAQDLAIPATPTIPAGGTLPSLYELATYKDQLVRLSVMGASPIWPWAGSEGEWIFPGVGTSAVNSLFRGPIKTTTRGLVDSVTVANSTQVPDSAIAGGLILEVHENVSFSSPPGTDPSVTKNLVDAATGQILVGVTVGSLMRPRCIAIGTFLLCFSVNLSNGTIRADVIDSSAPPDAGFSVSISSAGTANSTTQLAVTAKDATTATVAYTDVNGVVQAVDFVPSTATSTGYTLHSAAAATFTATQCLGWVQDFGGSGKLALAVGDYTDGVMVHWDFGAIAAGVSTAAADYLIDDFFQLLTSASATIAAPYSIAAYTTGNDASGAFVVMYDVVATGNSAGSVVLRGSRSGGVITAGAAYWYGTALASKFYQPGDGGTYILTSFSNSANPTTPQNTYFACLDGIAQPVPQATMMPQAGGGLPRRSSSLASISANGTASKQIAALATLADLQYVAGVPYQLLGVSVVRVEASPQQDTTTSEPVEAFGALLVPGSTLMAFDGRTYGEAIFAIRPEPPKLIPANIPTGATVAITHNAADKLIGAPMQPLAATQYDVVMGAAVTINHSTGENVTVSGGNADYSFIASDAFIGADLSALDDRSLSELLSGGSITVAGSANPAQNDGTFTIAAAFFQNPGLMVVRCVATTQVTETFPNGRTISVISPNPGRFFYSAPGAAILASDPTWASQLLVINGTPGFIKNQGTFVLDAANPCGSGTLAGHPYFFLYAPAYAASARFEEIWTSPPTVSLQLADPTTANHWTLANAAFDQTYVGAILTATNTVNPSNSLAVRILQVIDATHIVTSDPLAGGILRNEDLGATGGITYSVAPAVSLSVGDHSYVAVYSRHDANGRKWRSPPSIPVTVTTSADFPGVTAQVQCLHQTGQNCMIELYRAQTGVGGAYNLVAALPNDPQTEGVVFNDTFTDAQILEQEELFTDGGILGGTPIAGVYLIAVHQGRVFCVSTEAPQSLFYSNPDGAGSGGVGDGLLFDTTNFSLDIIDQHGALTAIKSMDTTLVAIKGDSVYAIAGSGPDASGQNGAFSSRLIASGVGTSNPRSVTLQVGSGAQAGGVWFESRATRAGIFTVTRGLTVEYTGKGVRDFTSETIVAALCFPTKTQLRWYTVSGRTLVYDWTSNLWSTNTGQPVLAAVLYQDLPTYAPTGALAGYVLQEETGLFEDGRSATFHTYVPYAQKVASAWLSVGGLKGYQRWFKIQGVGESVGDHLLTANLYADYDDTNLIASVSRTFAAGEPWNWEITPPESGGKLDAVKVVITGTDLVGSTTGTAGFSVTGITILIGVKRGLGKLPDTARLT